MKRILILSGTTEGNQIAGALSRHPVKLYLSVATEYGKACAQSGGNVEVVAGRMDGQGMEEFIWRERIDIVVDATHPFARIVTQNAKEACERTGTQYLRCLRSRGQEDPAAGLDGRKEKMVETDSVGQAAEYLKSTAGNILIATGSKELEAYTAIPDYRNRCYVRVLSVKESIEKSISLGFEGRHLIAMQGPFSKEMNKALICHTGAEYFVTKESGKAGGFEEKREAARELGVNLVTVRRPEETGLSAEQIIARISGTPVC